MSAKPLISIVVLLILIGAGFYLVSSRRNIEDATIRSGTNTQEASPEVVATSPTTSATEVTTTSDETSGNNYLTYTEEIAKTLTSKASNSVVLFFHAGWCPTCRTADKDIKENMAQLVETNIYVLKVDFDTAIELRKKYGVTVQHTFVQIDRELNELAQWNGGGVSQILENVK